MEYVVGLSLLLAVASVWVFPYFVRRLLANLQEAGRNARTTPHVLAAVDAWEHLFQVANSHQVPPAGIAAFRVAMLQIVSLHWVSAANTRRWMGRSGKTFVTLRSQALGMAVHAAVQACGTRLYLPNGTMTIALDRVIVDVPNEPATVYWCVLPAQGEPAWKLKKLPS